jgi:GNAT superfamily N-acetyltransferase
MAADLPTCAAIWRESINDYLGRLAQPQMPEELAPILRLYAHLHATDPDRFVVAERPIDTGSAIDGFAVATIRGDVWFLSMLFVRPEVQARGLGRALLAKVSPPGDWPGVRATATDSLQPISNGLYASVGIVPRVPLLRLVGLPGPGGAFPALPDGIRAIRFDEVDGGVDGLERAALHAELTALDREVAGFDRAPDRPLLDREGRIGFLYHARDGSAVGYGFAGESGRVGPVAVREAGLLGPVLGHLLSAIRPRGAFAVWVPGTAGEAIVPLLRAGFRIDGFPCLLCWDRPFADFARYLPMSPGLL